ncbi:MAG: aminoglycoside phosphotransferase [Maricaulis sp.]|jgi:aminoglycoside/choline kinase family phosphotransferase|nr:aminoglycoside phosphotransferase [Maricaulis sp.]HAQ35818.1 aminoglycoside phosphotransferase [Alphaproteobacteria bacterium]
MDSTRAAERTAFIDAAGWGEAAVTPFPGDASTRRYFRLTRGNETAVLMDAPAQAEGAACPPDASPQDRATLGYNALARLAGPNLAAFTGLSSELTARGFSAPRILSADMANGFLLLEDLGDRLFVHAIAQGEDESTLYAHAIDTLAAIYRASFPDRLTAHGAVWPLLDYDAPALGAEAGLFLDWYALHRAGPVSDTARAEWESIWNDLFAALDRHATGPALRDYHAENLLWLPDRDGPAKVGLLDFQDALFAHPAYDLVSLLEDARRDVDPSLAAPLKRRFMDQAGLEDAAAFDTAYAVLGAQRNAKILGIFIRLSQRDGKPKYLDFLPRVARHFVHDLSHPRLAALRRWTETHAPAVFDEAGR